MAARRLRSWSAPSPGAGSSRAVGFNSDEAVYAGQAAAIAGDRGLAQFFPVFRAHPMLFQGLLSLGYHFGTSELAGRLLAAAFGVGTIVLAYLVAKLLYGTRAGRAAPR